MPIRRSLFIFAIMSASLIIPQAHAALQGTVSIEQISPTRDIGSWLFYTTANETKSSTEPGVDPKKYAFSFTEFGPVTIKVEPPPGMQSSIIVYRGGELFKKADARQLSVNLYPGDIYRFVVQYSFSALGSLGVTTQPFRATFRITGPGNKRYSARTPHTFTDLPAGRYSIRVSAPRGCLLPPVYVKDVTPEQRVTLQVELACGKDALARRSADPFMDNINRGPSKRALRDAKKAAEALRAAELRSGANRSASN